MAGPFRMPINYFIFAISCKIGSTDFKLLFFFFLDDRIRILRLPKKKSNHFHMSMSSESSIESQHISNSLMDRNIEGTFFIEVVVK